MDEFRTKIGQGGRRGIPATYRKILAIEPGDEVILVLTDGEVRILTPDQAVRRAQAIVRHHIPEGRRLSEELIKERRLEAGRD